jgi:hypothetical protein
MFHPELPTITNLSERHASRLIHDVGIPPSPRKAVDCCILEEPPLCPRELPIRIPVLHVPHAPIGGTNPFSERAIPAILAESAMRSGLTKLSPDRFWSCCPRGSGRPRTRRSFGRPSPPRRARGSPWRRLTAPWSSSPSSGSLPCSPCGSNIRFGQRTHSPIGATHSRHGSGFSTKHHELFNLACCVSDTQDLRSIRRSRGRNMPPVARADSQARTVAGD